MAFPAYLQPDEQTLHELRRDGRSVLGRLVATWVGALVLAVAGTTLAMSPRLDTPAWLLPLSLAGPPLAAIALTALVVVRVRTTRYTVTDQRVYATYGRLRFNLLQTTYDKLTDLHVRQGLLGRLWGFGDVLLNTAGTHVAFAGVQDPFVLKTRIEAARTAFIARLVGEHAAAVESRAPWAAARQVGTAAARPALAHARTQGRAAHAATAATAAHVPAAAGADGVAGGGGAAEPWGQPEGQSGGRAHGMAQAEADWTEATAPESSPRGPASHKDVLWTGQPAPAAFLERAIGAVLMAVVGLGMLTATAVGFELLLPGLALTAAGIANAVAAFIRYRTSRFAITRAGVVVTTGWLGRRRSETTFSKVTDVTTTQGFLGRILGFGTIQVNTAGAARAAVAFTGVADPEGVKALIDHARGA